VIELHSTPQPHVYIVILNWNGWRDTIECLDSVFRVKYPDFTVIVCDNDSSDGSMEKIQDWAHGNTLSSATSRDLQVLIDPPCPKPVAYVALTASEISSVKPSPDVRLVLIQTGSNLGFAGGNNVGVRYALAQGHCDYVWLLNNDTVIEPGSLTALVLKSKFDPMLGICGSLLRDYAVPHEIQTTGRKYSPWSGRTSAFRQSAGAPGKAPDNRGYVVEGASMLVSGRFLEKTGLLEESYFLFFEELDWMKRGSPAFHFGYAPESVVYHKTGASIGSAIARTSRSALSDFYQTRNRLVFTRRHYPWFLPSVMVAVVASALQRILIGKPKNAGSILRGALASLSRTRSKGQAFR
jgi:GT2 family glycosyltransferase